jgi:hypothetical protein
MISGATNGRESKSMTQEHLLALIEQLESDIARLEDTMQSAQLTIKRLMANMKRTTKVECGDDAFSTSDAVKHFRQMIE